MTEFQLTAEIDGAILNVAERSWQKVALILGRAKDNLPGTVTFEQIAERVEALAAQGKLESQGNLSKWRHSEIKLPHDTAVS